MNLQCYQSFMHVIFFSRKAQLYEVKSRECRWSGSSTDDVFRRKREQGTWVDLQENDHGWAMGSKLGKDRRENRVERKCWCQWNEP